jgi:hypothetical protein
MIFSITTYYPAPGTKSESRSLPTQPQSEGKEICVMVCTAAIGLLALSLFLSLGGLCASLAPWVILAGTRADARQAGWRWWCGASGVLFCCLGLLALLVPAPGGIASFAGGVLGLLCGVRYLVPICLVGVRSARLRLARKSEGSSLPSSHRLQATSAL